MIKIRSILLHLSKMIQLYTYAINKNLNFSGKNVMLRSYVLLVVLGSEIINFYDALGLTVYL